MNVQSTQLKVPDNRPEDRPLERHHIGRRLIGNTVTEAGCRLITAVMSLIVVPVVVGKVGVSGYGVWEATLALASLSTLFLGAISGTLLWSISRANGIG